jgi:6-pyruvoyltetrahydropterin/6-carboxytetrahydropterin synthase
MYVIRKQFKFSAAHHLAGLPDDHPCSRPHGHNYTVEVVLNSKDLNDVGFVRDYRNLDILKKFIDQNWDHRDLNEVFPYNPTAENLAGWLYQYCKGLWVETNGVRVSETDKTWAEYWEY